MCICETGRWRFRYIQSLLWRAIPSITGVLLSPIWSCEVLQLGSETAPSKGRTGKGSVYFFNHRSNADPWFSGWTLTRMGIEGKYVYKSSLGSIPIFGCCAPLAGDLSAKFGDKAKIAELLQKSKDTLNAGYNIIVFPEGTRSPSGILQEFKPAFFKICAEVGATAVPVCMLGTECAWPLGGLRFGCARVIVGIGDPIYPSGPDGGTALVEAVEEKMVELARSLLEGRDGEVSQEASSEPYLTGRPYPYWSPPPNLADLDIDEQVKLLRTGKTHQRGAKLL